MISQPTPVGQKHFSSYTKEAFTTEEVRILRTVLVISANEGYIDWCSLNTPGDMLSHPHVGIFSVVM